MTPIVPPYYKIYPCIGGEDNFPYAGWILFKAEYLRVYKNGILLSLNTDYSLTSVLTPGAVLPVSFVPISGDVIELNLVLPYELPVSYQDSNALKAETLNLDDEYLIALIAQNDSNNSLSPRYISSVAPQYPKDLVYPTKLATGQFFMMSDSGFVASSVTPDPAASTLEAELASSVELLGAAKVNTKKNVNLQTFVGNLNFTKVVSSGYSISIQDYGSIISLANSGDSLVLPDVLSVPEAWWVRINFYPAADGGFVTVNTNVSDSIRSYGTAKLIGAYRTFTFCMQAGVWLVTDDDIADISKSQRFEYIKPDGEYMYADGRAVSRATYNILFERLGTSWGVGDGSTTFNIPLHKQKSPVGYGTGGGLTTRLIAATGGEEKTALTSANNGPHSHGINSHGPGQMDCLWRNGTGGKDFATAGGPGDTEQGLTIDSSGSGTPHNTMHPFYVDYPMIKVL